jgi:hypothetical protein
MVRVPYDIRLAFADLQWESNDKLTLPGRVHQDTISPSVFPTMESGSGGAQSCIDSLFSLYDSEVVKMSMYSHRNPRDCLQSQSGIVTRDLQW